MADFYLDDILNEDTTYQEKIISLLTKLEDNEEEIEQLKEKIDKLIKKSKKDKIISDTKNKTSSPKHVKAKKEIITVDNMEYYKELLSISTSIDDLKEFLPKKTDDNYDTIINSLLLSLQKDYVVCQKLAETSSDKEELKILKREIQNIEDKKNLIYDYKDALENQQIAELVDKKAKIFYTLTNRGNVKLLGDIKEIPSEVYDDFNVLFESIRTGKFKNPKVIKSGNRFYGNPFMEVKLKQARITFEILSQDIIVVTGAFVKKVQTSKRYNSIMINNKQLFLANKEELLAKKDNKQFIESQNKITEEVSKIFRKEK
ncbi:MAG: hypothetical protein ACI4OT_03360 [Bacilli bacterium]